MSKALKYSFKVKNAECTKSVAAAFFVHLVNVKSLSVRATYIQLPLPSSSFSRPQRLSTPIIRLFTLRALCVSCARFETFTHKLYIYSLAAQSTATLLNERKNRALEFRDTHSRTLPIRTFAFA